MPDQPFAPPNVVTDGLLAHVRSAVELVAGPLPDSSRKVTADVEVLDEEKLPSFIRRKITLAVEAGDRLPAYLLIPCETIEPRPAVLCLHQTTPLGKAEPAGLGGSPNMHYAAQLAERGYVTLAPDYSLAPAFEGYGEYRNNAYLQGYASSTMKGIWNHMRAVDLLQSLPQVQSERIGCIGHSLGGFNTLMLALFDERVKVMVTSCGFTSFVRYFGGNLAGFSHAGYMPRIAEVYDNDPAKMPFDFPELIAALAPRPLLACSPTNDYYCDLTGVQECIAAAAPAYAGRQASEHLLALYPEGDHDFPDEMREAAYDWFDRWL